MRQALKSINITASTPEGTFPTVVIAMIDIIPYKDLIVGDNGHVIRYKDR